MTRFTNFGNNWKLEKKDKNVQAYTTAVSGSDFRAYKIEAVESSLAALVAQQKDALNHLRWMEGISSSELVNDAGDSYFTYAQVKTPPWPIKDRDSVVESSISQDKDTLEVYIHFRSNNELQIARSARILRYSSHCLKVTHIPATFISVI